MFGRQVLYGGFQHLGGVRCRIFATTTASASQIDSISESRNLIDSPPLSLVAGWRSTPKSRTPTSKRRCSSPTQITPPQVYSYKDIHIYVHLYNVQECIKCLFQSIYLLYKMHNIINIWQVAGLIVYMHMYISLNPEVGLTFGLTLYLTLSSRPKACFNNLDDTCPIRWETTIRYHQWRCVYVYVCVGGWCVYVYAHGSLILLGLPYSTYNWDPLPGVSVV